MALAEAFTNSQALSTTEWSLPRDASYSSASPQTDDGIYQIFIDLDGMITGDQVTVKVYEKVSSTATQRVVFQTVLISDQGSEPVWVSPSLFLMHGWDVTLTATVGTPTVEWSIRKVS